MNAHVSFGSHPQNRPHDASAQMPPRMIPANRRMTPGGMIQYVNFARALISGSSAFLKSRMISQTCATTAASPSVAYESIIVGTWMWIQKLLISTGRSRAIDGGMKSGLSRAARVARNARSDEARRTQRARKMSSNTSPTTIGAARDEEQGLEEVPDERLAGERGPLDRSEDVIREPHERGGGRHESEPGLLPDDPDDREEGGEHVAPRRLRERVDEVVADLAVERRELRVLGGAEPRDRPPGARPMPR